MEIVSDYILIRRPAIPRYWDPIARPHVAVIIEDPASNNLLRYYLSCGGQVNEMGKEPLEVTDIDILAKDMDQGTFLEVKFNASVANLYKLEMHGGLACWRWVGKYRGVLDFDYPSSIDWESLIIENRAVTPHEIIA
ncbi:MAG: hypothetical protein ACTSUO_00705 [Candidatus Thorarchaeota archaeon]